MAGRRLRARRRSAQRTQGRVPSFFGGPVRYRRRGRLPRKASSVARHDLVQRNCSSPRHPPLTPPHRLRRGLDVYIYSIPFTVRSPGRGAFQCTAPLWAYRSSAVVLLAPTVSCNMWFCNPTLRRFQGDISQIPGGYPVFVGAMCTVVVFFFSFLTWFLASRDTAAEKQERPIALRLVPAGLRMSLSRGNIRGTCEGSIFEQSGVRVSRTVCLLCQLCEAAIVLSFLW